MDKADREPDGPKRATLLKQAESLAQKDMPWLPIRFNSQTELVAPKVGGYVPNAADFNRSRWLWLR
jgi:oligopeptide transport system substrate-binding protein